MVSEIRAITQQWTVGTVAIRLTIITLLWFVLAEGELHYWGLVLIAIFGGAFASLIMIPDSGLSASISGWARFIPYFLMQSVIGGIDVAYRALAPGQRIDPAYVEFHFQIAEEPARVFVANAMTLMPGSLSVDLKEDRLILHVLDPTMPTLEQARTVEMHAARMFRLELPG